MTNFDNTINSSKPTLVDFYAKWCGPCKMQIPIVDKVAEHFGDKINVIKVDVDQEHAIAEPFSIQSIPTLILFKDGKILWRVSGVRQAPEIEAKIKEYL